MLCCQEMIEAMFARGPMKDDGMDGGCIFGGVFYFTVASSWERDMIEMSFSQCHF